MDELHDVAAQTPSNNDGLFYNSTNSLWENKSIATALGYTPANAATTLTINGVTFDLSTSRTFTVGSVTGSGAAGQVAYWTGTSAQAGSNNFTWNNSLNLFSILYAGQQSTANVGFNLKTNNTSGGMASFAVDGNTATGHKFLISHVQDDQSAYLQNYSATQISYRDIFFLGRKVTFETTASNYASRTQVLTAHSTGNLSVGTTSDSGERLQVTGTAVVKDITTSSVASALFQLSSTTKGFLPPRMTTTQKNAIATPAAGLVVYDTTLNKLCVYTTAWETITSV
jgi:hypothetical protein